ncbi:hypothetical protein CLV96_0003 [Leptospira meyeri]|uniref:Uncharacterized protein n=1 Tax=Leptospira meyeri TaxID=29508 RepID=A0A4R8MSN8_LEPME|nr:hypothetical protein [Leptospira meyeri]EKJ88699.1 hypothetical protein LEP1GSC017_3967 [Leptospira meyeri serovar Hardjo str. Went 5]TDY71048.1 hypothetical protein CLV96_0003 [Leptospira meyeri]
MENIWTKVKKERLNNPIDIVNDIFKPLPSATDNLVGYSIQKVNFFPEEVSYEPEYITHEVIPFRRTIKPHPEFGYDPDSKMSKEQIRFRVLVHPKKNKDISVELFKVKFPILFFPLQIFCDQHSYPNVKSFFKDGKLFASDEKDFINKIMLIASSDTTLNIIQRLMSFQ